MSSEASARRIKLSQRGGATPLQRCVRALQLWPLGDLMAALVPDWPLPGEQLANAWRRGRRQTSFPQVASSATSQQPHVGFHSSLCLSRALASLQRRLLAMQGLRCGVYPAGLDLLGPIRRCKYFMRYDSRAQTLLKHRPLTIFSGSAPFGKVGNNEINKHSLPLVTARAP